VRRIGVLASGSGTILEAILEADLPVAVVLVDDDDSELSRANLELAEAARRRGERVEIRTLPAIAGH
jgi:folate-dependent phosphoribosylglycinamide formyltransferase PurN